MVKERSGAMRTTKKWEWNQFGKLQSCKDLEEYLIDREYQHSKYFHYTDLNAVDGILENKGFWLSNVSRFNDTMDTEQFGAGPQPFFSLCFSTGIHENLPLWYLYSGVDGRGARIQLTSVGIRDLIQNGSFSLCRINVEHKAEQIMPLKHGETMDLSFRDVIYAQPPDKEGTYALKYNTMTNYQLTAEEFEAYRSKHMGFCKGLIWFYEKETRLLVRLKGVAEAEWKQRIQATPQEDLRVVLSFDESLYKRIKITLAPNISREEIEPALKGKDGIIEFLRQTSFIQPSQYAGTVKMRLCDRCDWKNKQESK